MFLGPTSVCLSPAGRMCLSVRLPICLTVCLHECVVCVQPDVLPLDASAGLRTVVADAT